jgi:hypothetical protein
MIALYVRSATVHREINLAVRRVILWAINTSESCYDDNRDNGLR